MNEFVFHVGKSTVKFEGCESDVALALAKHHYETVVLDKAGLHVHEVDMDQYGCDYMRIVGDIARRQKITAIKLVRLQALNGLGLLAAKKFVEACEDTQFIMEGYSI